MLFAALLNSRSINAGDRLIVRDHTAMLITNRSYGVQRRLSVTVRVMATGDDCKAPTAGGRDFDTPVSIPKAAIDELILRWEDAQRREGKLQPAQGAQQPDGSNSRGKSSVGSGIIEVSPTGADGTWVLRMALSTAMAWADWRNAGFSGSIDQKQQKSAVKAQVQQGKRVAASAGRQRWGQAINPKKLVWLEASAQPHQQISLSDALRIIVAKAAGRTLQPGKEEEEVHERWIAQNSGIVDTLHERITLQRHAEDEAAGAAGRESLLRGRGGTAGGQGGGEVQGATGGGGGEGESRGSREGAQDARGKAGVIYIDIIDGAPRMPSIEELQQALKDAPPVLRSLSTDDQNEGHNPG